MGNVMSVEHLPSTPPTGASSEWSPAGGEPTGNESSLRLSATSYFAWIVLAAASVYFVVVLAFAERRNLETAVADWGRRMPIIAVLREDVAEERAKQLAERIRGEVAGLDVTLVGRREARSMLALQEPWLRQLPEMLVGELPVIIEFRHPALFVAPRELDSFIAYVRSQPEVDFVVFNSLGHDEVVEALSTARRHANALLVAISAVSFNLLLIVQHQLIQRRKKLWLSQAFVLAVVGGTLASILGFVALWGTIRWGFHSNFVAVTGKGLPFLACLAVAILLILGELLHTEFPQRAKHG